jgi:uncharacterized protein (DUF1330 family)
MAAYVVATVQVTDPTQYKEYMALAPIAIAKYGGKYLTRGGAMETMEGDEQTKRVVLLEFPDMDAARNFYDSPEYRAAREKRKDAAIFQLVLLEEFDPNIDTSPKS